MESKEEDQKNNVSVSKSIFKEWLEQLQQESWQLELLISGFAIYGIYASRPLLKELSVTASIETDGILGFIVSAFVSALTNGWMIFFINLIIHVIFRGLWIGAIGLRYVSDDIDFESLRYSNTFTEYLKRKIGSYDDFIEKLERICSVIFAYTFLLFLLFFSAVMFSISFMLLAAISTKFGINEKPLVVLPILIYLIVGLIVFVDFITLGGLKKVKDNWVSKSYLYIFRFYSTITLSFLYRPLLYNFIDNKFTVKLFYFSIPYIFFIVFGSSLFTSNVYPYIPPETELKEYGLKIYDNNYDDLREKMLEEYPNEERKLNKVNLPVLTMEKFKISDDWSSLFVKVNSNSNEMFDKDEEHVPYFKENLSIAWFELNHADDLILDSLVESKETITRDLYIKLRKLRKQIKSEGLPIEDNARYKLLRDSIQYFTEFYSSAIEEYRESKARNALEKYMEQLSFYIDGDTLEIENYFFYDHPNFNEKGIKCFFRTDSLSLGFHNLELKKYYKKDDDLDSTIYTLPFMKIQ